MIPLDVNPHGLLVIVDFSWWLNRSFRVGGLDGMMSMTIGNLAYLLRGVMPSHLAVAVDSIGPTWRHDLYEHYKGNREPKPREFYTLSDRALEIVRLHRVPLLYAEGYEADDAMAAAVRFAKADGLHVALLTADKDLAQLVDGDVVIWDGRDRVRRSTDIEADPKHPVPPSQIADLLAIVGDKSDNVPGVDGMGPVAAAKVLRAFLSIDSALDSSSVTPSSAEIKDLERRLASAKRNGDDTTLLVELLTAARLDRDLAGYVAKMKNARDALLLSRRLVTLDSTAPIEWDINELAVGGYDIVELRRAYRRLGFMQLAEEVSGFAKEHGGIVMCSVCRRPENDHAPNCPEEPTYADGRYA